MGQVGALWFIWNLIVYFTFSTHIQAYPTAKLPCEDDDLHILLPETIPEPLVEVVPELPIVSDITHVNENIITNDILPIEVELKPVLPEIVSVAEETPSDVLFVNNIGIVYKPDSVNHEIKPLEVEIPLEPALIDKTINVQIDCEDEIVAIDLPTEYQEEQKYHISSELVEPIFNEQAPNQPIVLIPEDSKLIIDENNMTPFVFQTPEGPFVPCEHNSEINFNSVVIPPAPRLPELIAPGYYTIDNPLEIQDDGYIKTHNTNEQVTKEVIELLIHNLPNFLSQRIPALETVVVNVIKSFVLPSTLLSEVPSFNSIETLPNYPSFPPVSNFVPCSSDLPHFHEHVALPYPTV